MTVLVTGGAGYIGSHVAHLLAAAGTPVLVVDDLSTGRPERIEGLPLVRLDLSLPTAVGTLHRRLVEHDVTAVVHLAALKRVDESVVDPARYFVQNVAQTAHVLTGMHRAGVRKLVLSSTAAVYGQPRTDRPVSEDDPTLPENPYGSSKLACESLVRWAPSAYGVDVVALRYFNVAGAATPALRDLDGHNLVSIIERDLREGRREVRVFGDDYPTRDGTCVRDYVHVGDLADAHLRALDWLTGATGFHAFNIGTGAGATVMEVVRAVGEVTGHPLDVTVTPRRPGDPASVVADPARFMQATGWAARHDLRSTVASVLTAGSA
jgi:UDP-glucose 4-epimerase